MGGKYRKVAIVGAGAVGLYYGGRLAEAGVDVCFLVRSDYENIRHKGITIDSIAGNAKLPKVCCAKKSEDIGPVDLVIIAWKTTSNVHYQQVISPLLGEHTHILTLQNGLGSVERLAELFGGWHVFGGLCFVCINRVGPGHVNHTAAGLIRIGSYDAGKEEELSQLVKFLGDRGVLCESMDDLERAQWMKLVWNIPFNGLSIAEGGVDTQKLLEMQGVEQRVLRLMREVQAVAAGLGHFIEDAFLDHQIERTRPMRAYRPSSMIDYVEGREVEVDAIWREPLRRARVLGVETPELEELLRSIEWRLAQRDADDEN